MMKKYLIIATAFLVNYQLFSQANIGFYHLGGATPQNANFNAAAFPRAKSYFTLPGFSGFDLSINNRFGIVDLLKETGDSTLIDINGFLKAQKKRSYLNTSFTLPVLMVGARLNEKSFFTFFINVRSDATIFYPVKLMNFLWEGNGAYVGERYEIDDISYDFTAYKEIGVGYGREFNIMGFNTTIAGRLKLINGMVHSSIKKNLSMSIYTSEEDYSLEVGLDNGELRSAGLEFDDASYFIWNQNNGFGLDLAAQTEITDKISASLAINDLGFITWKEKTEVTKFNGVDFTYEGLNLDDLDKFADAFLDSLESLDADTTVSQFTTTLNSSVFLSGSYQVTKDGFAQATLSNYFTQGRMKPAFGVGYLQNIKNWLSASGTLTVAPQKSVDLGLALMLRGAPFQMYLAMDNIFHTINIPKASGLNFKFGINFMIGKPGPKKKKEKRVKDDETVKLEDYYQLTDEFAEKLRRLTSANDPY